MIVHIHIHHPNTFVFTREGGHTLESCLAACLVIVTDDFLGINLYNNGICGCLYDNGFDNLPPTPLGTMFFKVPQLDLEQDQSQSHQAMAKVIVFATNMVLLRIVSNSFLATE